MFPNIDSQVGNIEFLYERLPQSNIVVMKFKAEIYNEANYCEQSCFVFIDLDSKIYYQICKPVIIKDYMEKPLLEIIKDKELVYDGTKCNIV